MTNEQAGLLSLVRLGHSFVIRHWGFVIKKIPPPTPEGREGRLFPPEQSSKTAQLLNELYASGNKILHKPGDASRPLS
jgi:hypothetical protein